MSRVVAAIERKTGNLTVVCDDGSVFTLDGDKWCESPPVPGTRRERKGGGATTELAPWAKPR